jgi:hypothetical protein
MLSRQHSLINDFLHDIAEFNLMLVTNRFQHLHRRWFDNDVTWTQCLSRDREIQPLGVRGSRIPSPTPLIAALCNLLSKLVNISCNS